jgi:hypothetical protein
MPKADGTATRSEKKALNKQAFAAARVEMAKIEATIPFDPYRDEPEDHLPKSMLSGHVLKRKRGDLIDEACINRITDLVACGVTLSRARKHIGVPKTLWSEWRKRDHCELKKKLLFAKYLLLERMSEQFLEIADDPDLSRPPTIKVVKREGAEPTHGPDGLTINEKLKIAEMHIKLRQWSLKSC